MASVRSLGVHLPTGLCHAIEEGILPPEPPASSYTWEIITDVDLETGDENEDELVATEKCVIWSRGRLFCKSFHFKMEQEPVTQAVLTYFPTSNNLLQSDTDGPKPQPDKKAEQRFLSRALVVFLKTQAHIFFLSGATHIVHIPFEVESACAAPVGVIIQKKTKVDSLAQVSLRLPKVPPNSFISPQTPPLPPQSSQVGGFSTERLGKPKTLPLRLSSTMENMWQPPPEVGNTRWPRLVCLTDPLLELGLVVTRTDKSRAGPGRRAPSLFPFLDPAEEIIHVEAIKLPQEPEKRLSELIIAVTANRERSVYSVWRLTYLESEDWFLGKHKKSRDRTSRRRSSMPPALASGTTTPLPRESLGASLPVKKTRKSDKKEKTLETALGSLDPEKGGDVTRRQSRRVSSLLARADLSAAQDRSNFTEQSHASIHGGRRVDSHGSQPSRTSNVYNRVTFSGTFNPQLNSLHETPVDNLLDELRAGGDFEGFHSMDLDDHDFDGLSHEMLFTKIHSIPMDNTNVRYSLSNKPARTQAKVFILVGPPCSVDEQGRTQLLLGIQDPLDKRLQLLPIYVEKQEEIRTPHRSARISPLSGPSIKISCGQLKKALSVVDSCKIVDGDQSILILSEDKTGNRELSLQAPWSVLTSVQLPVLYDDNLDCLDYSGRFSINKEVRGRRTVGLGFSAASINSICHPLYRGVVDLQDNDMRFHRIRIKLRPSTPIVYNVLDTCRSVLPTSQADKIVAGWWHVMQWRKEAEPQVPNMEWSSLVILLLGMFLVLGHNDEDSLRSGRDVVARQQPRNSWEAMQISEAPNSSACPPWMRSKGWQWLLDEGVLESSRHSRILRRKPPSNFMSLHVALAKQYMASVLGLSAFGSQGYLPTAVSRDIESRTMSASSIIIALHLLLEEQKLDVLSPEVLTPGLVDLRVLTWQITRWLGWRKHEALYELGIQASLDPSHDSELKNAPVISEPPIVYCVFDWIQAHLTNSNDAKFLTLADVYDAATHDVVGKTYREAVWNSVTPRTLMFRKFFEVLKPNSGYVEMVVAMHDCGFTTQVLETLPEAILIPLQDAIFLCQPNPPSTWSDDLLALINRTDVSKVLKSDKVWGLTGALVQLPTHEATLDYSTACQEQPDTPEDEGEGSDREAVVRALFKEDRRLNEAQDLLASNRIRTVKLDSKPEWSEPEYLERQKDLVNIVATNTLAIPSGRGLLYYGLRYPLLTQKLQIGGFNLTCSIKPANNTVGVDKSQFTEEKVNWAFFHQGVASGLAVSPHASGIDTSWILYNKPNQDLSNRHAGFLLALGLNGHLKSVAKWVAFKYLTPKHTMTSIGLLLGLAASYLGTMDSLITRLLSVHVTRMLPRGAAELNLSKHTQTTGIMGIGLLYCNSQHRRMSEIMMSEIGHIDDEDEEDPLRDEGYRLAAGFALGFINLGKGTDLRGLHDMRLTEKLLTIGTATKKAELVHILDRSAAGSIVAITLIFLKSEDHIVSRKVDVPESILQFDYIRPDILLLRTVAKNLILWSKIEASFEWVRDSLPREYQWQHRLTRTTKLQSKDLPFFSILAGLCFSIGLRFAGSGNLKVRDLLVHYLDEFMRITRLPAGQFDTEIARSNARMCMDLLALSSATVMAGTGDLIVLRRLRSLHGRDDPKTPYGSHLAAHLAIGALFLSCGSKTFGTSNLSIAALLVAFYPLFPSTVQDNQSHLQAFRHFWVLAVDPRCLITKDIITGQTLGVPVLIHLKPGSPSAISTAASVGANADPRSRDVITLRRNTPCLLPPLDEILAVRTDAAAHGFWDLTLDFGRDPTLAASFRENQTLLLRRRPPREMPFPATLRALGAADSTLPDITVADAQDPFSWVFSLPSLRGLTHAERAQVLDLLGCGGGVGEGDRASTAVDARLVLEAGLDGWERERLLGLRLLFEWADTRSSLVTSGGGAASSGGGKSGDEGGEKRKEAKGKGKSRRDKGKGKANINVNMTVGVDVDVDVEKMGGAGEDFEAAEAETSSLEAGWWLRDSVISDLKGKAWLAGRDS